MTGQGRDYATQAEHVASVLTPDGFETVTPDTALMAPEELLEKLAPAIVRLAKQLWEQGRIQPEAYTEVVDAAVAKDFAQMQAALQRAVGSLAQSKSLRAKRLTRQLKKPVRPKQVRTRPDPPKLKSSFGWVDDLRKSRLVEVVDYLVARGVSTRAEAIDAMLIDVPASARAAIRLVASLDGRDAIERAIAKAIEVCRG